MCVNRMGFQLARRWLFKAVMSQDTPRLRRRIQIAVGGMVTVCVLGTAALLLLVGLLDEARGTQTGTTARTLATTEQVEHALAARAAALRGFLLTGDRDFLELRQRAGQEMAAQLAGLRARGFEPDALDRLETALARLDTAAVVSVRLRGQDRDRAVEAWQEGVLATQRLADAAASGMVDLAHAGYQRALGDAAVAARRTKLLLAALVIATLSALSLLLHLLISTSRDLAARARTEQEHLLREILEQLPVGIFVVDDRGKPSFINRAAQAILGAGADTSLELAELTMSYGAFEAGTDRIYPTERFPLTRALSGETCEVSDMELRHGDDVVPLHVRSGPVHDAAGARRFAVAAFQDVRELQRHVMRDALTGLANRAAVLQTYRRDRMVGDRSGRPVAIAIIDIDHFKSINDRHGHATGDKVLQRTASTIARSLRLSDVVARWGGEEFVVILPDADAAGAVRAVEHALAAVRKLELSGPDGETFGVTFSAGVVVTRPGEALEIAVHRADTALYEAKRSGRDRVLGERKRTGVITAAIPLAQGTERLPGCGTVVRDANQEPGVRRTGRGRVQRQLDEPKTGTDS